MALRSQKRKTNLAQVTLRLLAGPFLRNGLASTWRFWLPRVLLIAGLTLWIYGPVFHGDWLLDDRWYLTDNPLMNGWGGLWKFWFQPGSWVEYYPIGETVMWLEWQLWGDHALGYHLANVGLHLVSALLVWHLLSKIGLRLAWLGGLIFAIHPVQVESVACISELKNTLSLPPFLLAMCAWIDYEEHGRRRDYLWALGLFLVAMLIKITPAPFPAMILLYAWWKRGRIQGNDLKACAPFVIVSLVLVFMTIWAGQRYEEMGHGHPEAIFMGGFFRRLALSGLNLCFYFSQSFLPVVLTPFHPKWTVDPHRIVQFLPWLVFGAAFYWFWTKRRTWGKHVLLGTGFFVLGVAPFLGFHTISYMSFTWVLDHLLYFPLIGLIGLVVAGLGRMETQFSSFARSCGRGIIVAVVVLMVWKGHAYAGLFTNEEVLWDDTLQRDPGSWLAHDDLGGYFIRNNRFPEALAQLNEAVRLKPDFDQAHYNLGIALDKTGHAAEALEEYRKALALNPDNEKVYDNLGAIEKRNGNLANAENLFTHALQLNPSDAVAYLDLGDILLQTGRLPQAIDLFKQALELNPDVAQLHYNLGSALLATGQLLQAVEQFETAVALDPGFAPAHENLGVTLARSGRVPEAIEQFQAVLQINPAYAAARDNLGLALAQAGRIPEAMEQFQQALRANPNDAFARQCLVKLQSLSSGAPAKP
ncbi:MAG: tetratricopeptide repeat protein [Methylacidiphilales bacterium]|nr:tetratricopeptide repeat protein [Candidatus Methylacidiphilales bacterium]